MKEYKINMKDIKLEEIYSIDLVLEPMEGVKVYSEEILEVSFEFEDDLTIGASCIERKIKSGHIKLAINDNVERYQGDVIIRNKSGGDIRRPYKKKIEKRLIECCDICYLVITEKECHWRENLDVPFEMFDMCDETGLFIGYNYTVCPSAKMDEDGHLLILFGEASEFKPNACVYEDGERKTELTTIEDYVAFWNRQSLETLIAIADEHMPDGHDVIHNADISKAELISLLKAGMEKICEKHEDEK